jgi:Ca-activated chloride channel family protein
MFFARPEMLWLLAALMPLVVVFLWRAWRKKQKLIREFVQSRLLAQLTVGVSARRQKVRLALVVLGVACLLVALARPLYGFAWEEARQRGLDILIAVDTSRSMLAADVPPSRLARAKLAALDLMRAAKADRLGLIAFAGTAFLQCPLTLDDNAFSESVNYLDTSIIPQGGTAVAQAIETALKAFEQSGDNHKVLILMTDGEDHESGVMEAAEKAAKANVRIFTVGIGSLEGDRLRVVDEQGKTSYLTDVDGKQVHSKLNTDLLQQLAAATQADYLRLTGPDPMKLLYDARLAALPRSATDSRLFRQFHERFQWPLGLGILLLAIEVFVDERRRVPRGPAVLDAANADLKRQLALGVLALCLLPLVAQASGDKAERDFKAGRFGDAQREYEKRLADRPQDPRLHYNAGTAAYRAGQYDQAARELGAAVLSPDPQLLARAYYNLGNSLFRLGERAEAPTNALAHWQQAVKNYESTLKLDPKDADAQFNCELVKQKIEELEKQLPKQQQPQQGDKDQDQKDNKDDQNKQDQKDQQQDKKQQQDQQKKQQQDASKDKKDQKKQDQQQQDQQNGDKKQEKQGQQNQKKEDGQDKKQPEPQPKDAQKPDPAKRPKPGEPAEAKPRDGKEPEESKDGTSGEVVPLGQMTPEQARQLLEAARAEERPLIFVPPEARRGRSTIHKEW